LKKAEQPFQFKTVSYLMRIANEMATTLAQLKQGLETCSDTSIFNHTFQTLSHHHFLTQGFSNDFAQWVLAACNRPELAEHLASLDIRDYLSLAELRADLKRLVSEYCEQNPQQAEQSAFEPFYFYEAIGVEVPLQMEAWTLQEFRDGLEKLSHAAFHFHFIASRLRLHLRTNDFSYWLESCLDLGTLARHVNRIDIYTNTLESALQKIISLVERELHS
jgi:hypothetical protein